LPDVAGEDFELEPVVVLLLEHPAVAAAIATAASPAARTVPPRFKHGLPQER
jgi:hypothetical protein